MSTPESNLPMINRRQILRSCLRGIGLVLLGGIATILGWRGTSSNCLRAHPCGACPLFSGCELPKAIDSKNTTRKPGHV